MTDFFEFLKKFENYCKNLSKILWEFVENLQNFIDFLDFLETFTKNKKQLRERKHSKKWPLCEIHLCSARKSGRSGVVVGVSEPHGF